MRKKHAIQSLTIQGAIVQIIGTVLIMKGVAGNEVFTTLDQIATGVGALTELAGIVMTYLGRKRANDNITLGIGEDA